MRDYSYEDMLKMQQEAAIRVREMKKRAAITVEEEEPPKKTVRPIPDEVKHISYPVELPDTHIESGDKDENEKVKQGGILSLLTDDKDALLVLTLAVILAGENSDYLTTLALIYLLL